MPLGVKAITKRSSKWKKGKSQRYVWRRGTSRYVPKKSVNLRIKGAIAPVMHNAMTWSSSQLTTAAGNFASFGIYANYFEDPYITSGGLPPRWYDELTALYNGYRVYAVKVTLYIEDTEPNATAENSMAFIGLTNSAYLPASSALEVQQKPRLFKQKPIPRNSGYARFSWFQSIHKMQNLPRTQTDDSDGYIGFAGNLTTPKYRPQIWVGAYTLDDVGSTTYRFRVQVTYYTRWSIMKDV